MRLSLLCLSVFFIMGVANAQSPTITSASEAVPGDILLYQNAAVSGLSFPATGTNVTWNYSALADSGGYELDTFVAASSTPYASVFAGSNLALIVGDGAYEYFQTNSTDWSLLGYISPGADTLHYQSPYANEFHFPFSYGSSYAINNTLAITSFTGFMDSSENSYSHYAAGYGTLITPTKTYTNVLQVENINIQTTKRFGITTSDTSASIFFVSPTTHSYIMQMNVSNGNSIASAKFIITGIGVTTSYTFNGTGDWSNAANWTGGVVPPALIPSGTTVTISPKSGGYCTLDVSQVFAAGSTITVTTGAIFNVIKSLTIVK